MTPEQADAIGKIVYKSEGYVIRAREDDTGLRVYVHRVKDGQEYHPRGYLLGSNALIMKEDE